MHGSKHWILTDFTFDGAHSFESLSGTSPPCSLVDAFSSLGEEDIDEGSSFFRHVYSFFLGFDCFLADSSTFLGGCTFFVHTFTFGAMLIVKMVCNGHQHQ